MSSRVIRVLYRTLLESAGQLEADVEAGRTLYHAIRSGAIAPYDGVKSDWQRERKYEQRVSDAAVIRQWTKRRPSMALVRSQFDQTQDVTDRRAVNERIDGAFAIMRELNSHNAMVRGLEAQGAFTPRRRSEGVRYRVGDVVEVNETGKGVIVAWQEARAHAFGELRVTYDILPDSPGQSDVSKLHRVPQEEIHAALDSAPVRHQSTILYFDGFSDGRHVPCASLARRYPDDDVAGLDQSNTDSSISSAPSILQLQFADECQLVQYVRCPDTTVSQFAMAALEGKWIGEYGELPQMRVHRALSALDQGELESAREILTAVVTEYPEYAYAWSKLGFVEFRAGNVVQALEHYERAVKLKPQLMDALAGLGTCATRLRRWSLAHHAAVELLRVQPNNETARLLLDNAILSSL